MWVIGNGESRQNIDIAKFSEPKVGCNAIHRDYYMDYLVCVDRRMMQEAINSGVNKKGTLVYTRPDWFNHFKTTKIRQVPNLPYVGSERWDEPFQWGSGPYAVLIGAMYTKLKEVKLIGFDLYSNTKKVNNIYKSTPNYDDASKRAVDPRYWIHQIGMVFECFPDIKFTIYNTDWTLPNQWKYPNVSLDNLNNL